MARSPSEDVVNPMESPADWTPELGKLANSFGIATEYWDQSGNYQQVSAETVQRVLAAFNVDASTAENCNAELEKQRLGHWQRMLPPVFVTRQGVEAVTWVHVPHGHQVRLWIELEDGAYRHDVTQVENWTPPQMVGEQLVGEASFRLPNDLPVGWHTLHAASETTSASVPLAVAPARLELPAGLDQNPAWGFAVQLYSMRSEHSWALGDLSDLADLANWSSRALGADFVQVNPVHAAEPEPPIAPSPYLPVSRRFTNPSYLRVEAIAEFAYLPPKDLSAVRKLASRKTKLNRESSLLDRDAAWTAKRKALRLVARVPRTPGREAEFRQFKKSAGVGLIDYATWCVIVVKYGINPVGWPEGFEHPQNPQVKAFAAENAEEIDFHCWLQWITDEQLADAQTTAKRAGMRLGVIHDLAVGVHPEGADAWALQDVLARGMCVGAPPDMYNQKGQNWSQPPWRPDALADSAFLPYRQMLQTVLRNSGALRIDHILGLFRLWWIPEGMPANEGTYVKYDHEALVNILVLEAHRAGAVVIGEDLGTVEDWVQSLLADRGILGTTIAWFEANQQGIKPPEQWRWGSMASVTTHDLPPTAGFLAGEHIRIRQELGLLVNDPDTEWQQFERDVANWREFLESRGMLRPDAGSADMVVAMHRLVAQSPARLMAVALPDAVGDIRTQNQPGTDQEYPNWRVPLTNVDGDSVLVEDLPQSAVLNQIVAAIGGGNRKA